MHNDRQIPIWFFIGSLLTLYGVLILGAGIYYGYLNPPPRELRVALWEKHVDIWWSLLLIIVGLVYVIMFRPGKAPKG